MRSCGGGLHGVERRAVHRPGVVHDQRKLHARRLALDDRARRDRHGFVPEDPHEERRRRRPRREGDEAHGVVELELDRLDVDRGVARAEVGVEELLRHLVGVGVERDAACREAGGVERLAHACLSR